MLLLELKLADVRRTVNVHSGAVCQPGGKCTRNNAPKLYHSGLAHKEPRSKVYPKRPATGANVNRTLRLVTLARSAASSPRHGPGSDVQPRECRDVGGHGAAEQDRVEPFATHAQPLARSQRLTDRVRAFSRRISTPTCVFRRPATVSRGGDSRDRARAPAEIIGLDSRTSESCGPARMSLRSTS